MFLPPPDQPAINTELAVQSVVHLAGRHDVFSHGRQQHAKARALAGAWRGMPREVVLETLRGEVARSGQGGLELDAVTGVVRFDGLSFVFAEGRLAGVSA